MQNRLREALAQVCEYALERGMAYGINARTAHKYGLEESDLNELLETGLITYDLVGIKYPKVYWMPTYRGLVEYHSYCIPTIEREYEGDYEEGDDLSWMLESLSK